MSSSAAGHDAQVVSEAWGRGPAPDPDPPCVHDLVARQAVLRPAAVAVECGAETVTYAELSGRARGLAARLAAHGLSHSAVVAVAAERSASLLTGLLGVLTAGCAYLALEPGQPAQRARQLAADAGAAMVLTDAAALAAFRGGPVPARSLAAETAAAQFGDPAMPRTVRPDDLAYVCYTSGSTGKPKGVCVTHRGVARLVTHPDWDFTPDDVFLQLAPVAFDASTFEIWTALTAGARLVVHPPGPVTAESIADVVRAHRVSVLHLTAGLLRVAADTEPGLFTGLRRLLTGGDVVSPDHVRRLMDANPGLTVTHAYGPTENTTFTTCWTVGPAVPDRLPIGAPIRGTTVAVLDDDLTPTAVGVTSELYTGGAGLARGYLGRPAETAARFLPDPAGPPGARMYATGDLARWRADGLLEFAGRADGQVKIRGYRVEPGEAEAQLRGDPAVRDAVVVTASGTDGERFLVAYVVPADGEAGADLAGVRERLAELLPDYLIPAVIVSMEALPVNHNGKIDRNALPASELASAAADAAAPETAVEEAIAGVWLEILGTSPGIHRNFFEAGGTSLTLMRVRARLQQVIGRPITTVSLFKHPTIHQLARFLAGDNGAPPQDRPSVPGQPGRRALAARAQRLSAATERGIDEHQ